ncbi:MAG TPA: transposase [Nitrospiria bacterium]
MVSGFKSDIHHRRSIRLAAYDYSKAGAYYLTLCSQDRECLFGSVIRGEMDLNDAGRMVKRLWLDLNAKFENVETDTYVIMPNHFHGVIILNDSRGRRGESCIRPHQGDHKDRPYGTFAGTLGRVIQAFKSITTYGYIQGVKKGNWPPFSRRLWQRNYYEHIIRNEAELGEIRKYIEENPAKWKDDENHPSRIRL